MDELAKKNFGKWQVGGKKKLWRDAVKKLVGKSASLNFSNSLIILSLLLKLCTVIALSD